ncbi:MAG: hypothetical protein ACRDKB_04055 [Actinomycetota bacterium]
MNRYGYGSRLVEWWVRLYTFGLAPEAASKRREELRADVWDQATAGHSDRQILARAMRGAGGDVAWRWRHGIFPPWLRLPVRLAATALVLLELALIQHGTGQHTLIGNLAYGAWFAFAFAAAASGLIGVWRCFLR